METFPSTREELRQYLNDTAAEVTIIKLTASWCGPCRNIAPVVHQLNKHYTMRGKNYRYIEVDVDQAVDLYAFFKRMRMANGIPTFLVYRKCDYSDDTFYVPYACLTGADATKLQQLYQAVLS
jgi:thiol:disulfide interchange protein